MTKRSSADISFFLIDGFNVVGVTTDIEDEVEAITQRRTGFGDAWERSLWVGVNEARFSQEGFFDDASDSVNAALAASSGTRRIVSYAQGGNTLGAEVACWAQIMQATYVRMASIAELHRANAAYVGSGRRDNCVLLAILAARVADAPGSSVDNLAATADGGIAYLQVPHITLDGAAKVVVRVEDSANDLDFATIATFADITVRTAEAVVLVGAIRRYTRAVWEFDGGGANKTITFAVMIGRY